MGAQEPTKAGDGTAFAVVVGLSVSHLLNDTVQSLIAAVYPILRDAYALTFTQIGLITLAFQLTASLLQPVVGAATDRRRRPWSLPLGMGVSLVGLLLLSVAANFPTILAAAALVGVGSSVFHPEASRIARLASGGRHGLAQSVFQVGGNAGSALGPLLAAFVVVPRGQGSLAYFSVAAVAAMVLLARIAVWYKGRLANRPAKSAEPAGPALPRRTVVVSLAVLLALVFSKNFYLVSLSSFYTFYLIGTFGLSVPDAQLCLFVFLGSVAVGTLAGGPVGDRVGFKAVIWGSILGVVPFTLALPHANLSWTVALTVPIGLVLASAFSAIVVYAQELVPGRVGAVAGLFFGFSFGMGAVGAAALGRLADEVGLAAVYRVVAFLPLIGLLAAFLPDLRRTRPTR